MSYNYEAVVIFNPDLDESAVREQTQKIETLVKAHGGAVARHDTWGKRPLGFRMSKVRMVFIRSRHSPVTHRSLSISIANCVLTNRAVPLDR